MKSLVNMIFLFLFLNVSGQVANPFMTDISGRPLSFKENVTIEGSPYLFEEYYPSEITLANGNRYSNVSIKLNLLDHQVQYLSEGGTEMVATVAIKRVKFLNHPDKDGTYSTILLESLPESWNKPNSEIYQVIDSGKTKLVKSIIIKVRDQKKYNETAVTRRYDRLEMYYAVLPGGEIKRIEKSKSAIADLFKDKAVEVQSFIDQNKLNFKNEKDYKMVFNYYNSLQ